MTIHQLKYFESDSTIHYHMLMDILNQDLLIEENISKHHKSMLGLDIVESQQKIYLADYSGHVSFNL